MVERLNFALPAFLQTSTCGEDLGVDLFFFPPAKAIQKANLHKTYTS